MFQGLQEDQLAGALEAMLFVTDEPVGVLTFSQMLEVPPAQVERVLVELRERLEEENRGVQLREVAGGWRLFTHPAYHELIEKYVVSWDTRRLSQAAMETLAIVAYLQPATRAQVASVRGVNSDSSINSLVEKGLLREAGSADAPGNPTLYATTRAFLERFGLRTVADLPDLDQFAPDDETRALIRERLSATRVDASAVAADELASAGVGGDAGAAAAAAAGGAQGVDGLAAGATASSPAGEEERDPFAGMTFDFDADAETLGAGGRNALAEAMTGSLGLVEKIDFDQLTFETDEE